jgi:hypothetical protein
MLKTFINAVLQSVAELAASSFPLCVSAPAQACARAGQTQSADLDLHADTDARYSANPPPEPLTRLNA